MEMTTAVSSPPSQTKRFPIVGIGCSAGGLEAVQKFLMHVPNGSGMGFVIVQHLAPDYESNLAQILKRFTPMSVMQVSRPLKLQPNCVYVIPPNKDLSITHGVIKPSVLSGPPHRHLPIDFFLRTLAEDQHDHAIAIILSGMGSDGALSLQAIKDKGGLILAQEPASARADSMPRSAIMSGLVDIIAIPEEMPARIASYWNLPKPVKAPQADVSPQDSLQQIIILLYTQTGHDFSLYKTSTLYRRIDRRIALHQLDNISQYVQYAGQNLQELDLLFKELLIGVTNFFRDPSVWEQLEHNIIPDLLKANPDGKNFRAWVPACSSGEEAYTLAILFKEALRRSEGPVGHYTLKIFATDIDPDVMSKARQGFYPRSIEEDVSPELLARYFVLNEENNGYRISKEIRDMVVFSPQNVISDPPFTRLDIISCRNLMIYFEQSLQKKLIPLFHYALIGNGILVLGSAETIGNFTDLFSAVNVKSRIFRRLKQSVPLIDMKFPIKNSIDSGAIMPNVRPDDHENIGESTDRLIQQHYSPAAVLVNGDGDILYISGRTGKYLEPASGKVNINLHAMAREGLREALAGVIKQALRQAEPIKLTGLQIVTEGQTALVNITVQGLEQPEVLRGRVLVVFTDVGKRSRRKRLPVDKGALEVELQQAREALQRTYVDMQTSMEELVSSNEELQSTNEELQSTNEELTTSKEELQSLNEELQTVNAELQSKVDELSDLTWVKNDMINLLNSIEIATVFVDNDMKIRRYTPRATELFKLIPDDVGRSFTDIATNLDYLALKADVEKVISTLLFVEKQIQTHEGMWFRIRIMPYRTLDNIIDGAVITFIDITEIKLLEEELRAKR